MYDQVDGLAMSSPLAPILAKITRWQNLFLDVPINNTPDKFFTSGYIKPTYTGLLTNYFSFTPTIYKTGLIKTRLETL